MPVQPVRHLAPPCRLLEGAPVAEARQQGLLHQQLDVAGLAHLGGAHAHVEQAEEDGVGGVDVDRGPHLMTGIDELEHLAGRVGVPDLGDHPGGGMDPAEVHERVPEVFAALLAGAGGGHRDLHRPRDGVFHRVLDGDDVELALRLLHLQCEVGGQGGGLAVARRAAEEDAAPERHADLGEDLGLLRGEAEALQGRAALDAVAVEEAGEEVVAVGLVRAALAAERGDGGGKRHLAAGANGKTLEGAPLIGGLGRALVLAVEEEAHDLAALVGGQRVGELELAVVDDAVDPAEAAVVLEHDVAGPGRRGLLEEHAHPPRRRRLATAGLAVGGAPAFGDLVEAGRALYQAGRHTSSPVAAERQQGGAQAAVALVAFGDQAAPVGVDGAHAPDPVVHGGVADQRAAPARGRTSRAPAEPGCGGPPHDPSPPAIPPAGIAPSGRGR